MTISTTSSSITISGNGATTDFDFPFVADSAEDLEVIYTDAAGTITTLAPSVYDVTINTTPVGELWGIGGTVTYPLSGSPIASGTTLTINRIVPYTQNISIGNQGAFYPQAVEQGLDVLELQIQQLETGLEFSLKAPISDGTPPTDIPSALARANQYLSFDSSGNPTITAVAPPSGTLPVLVTATIASLKAIVTPNLSTSYVYYVQGYTTANDGGEGFFSLTTSNPGADNGGTIIHSNTSGYYFLRQVDSAGYMNVLWFGADRTGAATSTTAIANALATLKTVYAPAGTYRVVTNTLFLSSGQELYGDGFQQTFFKSYSSIGSILTIGGIGSLQTWMYVHDIAFQFDNSVARSSGQRAVKTSNAAFFHLHRVDTLNGLVNFEFDDSLIFTAEECYARNGEIGINLVPSATYYTTTNLIEFTNCSITGNTAQAIRANGSGALTFNSIVFSGCDIEGNGTDGTGLDVCSFTNVGVQGIMPGISFQYCWFEGNRGRSDLSIACQNVFTGVVLIGNGFYSSLITATNAEVLLGSMVIMGNGLIVGAGPTFNLILGASTSGIVLGNRISRLSNSGNAITEVAQSTSRTSFTPSLAGSTTPGTQTYTTRLGKYSKIGTRVTVDFSISCSALDGATAGNMRITGLPFTSVNDGVNAGGAAVIQFDGVNLPAGGTNVAVLVPPNVTYASLLYSVDNASSAFIVKADITAPVTFNGTFSYDAAS